jgi:hypothetical protein
VSFTAEERARIKHFLSFPDWVAMSQSIQLGYPAASQPAFLLDDAFHRMTPDSERSIRQDLCECESIECQLSDARSRFKVKSVGNITFNDQETAQLRKELLFWTTRLGDDLGVLPDPYSRMMYESIGGMGGVQGKVSG